MLRQSKRSRIAVRQSRRMRPAVAEVKYCRQRHKDSQKMSRKIQTVDGGKWRRLAAPGSQKSRLDHDQINHSTASVGAKVRIPDQDFGAT
jgi:hypothetical protein